MYQKVNSIYKAAIEMQYGSQANFEAYFEARMTPEVRQQIDKGISETITQLKSQGGAADTANTTNEGNTAAQDSSAQGSQSGELTQEEWIAKKSLPANEAAEVAQAAMSNPTEFGGALVNSILDIDNLKDDPARALGGYIPDAALLIASGGVSALSKAAKTIRTVKGAGDKGNKLKGGMKAMNGTLDAQHSEKASESVDEASQESHLGKLHELADSL